jgi:uncharacterized protein
MPTTRTTVATRDPSRLLIRLAKHWAHRFAVERDGNRAVIDFGDSRCELLANPTDIVALVTADDASSLPQLETVVAEHLGRMAGDEVLKIEWTPTE